MNKSLVDQKDDGTKGIKLLVGKVAILVSMFFGKVDIPYGKQKMLELRADPPWRPCSLLL